jgi:hypothetical protein
MSYMGYNNKTTSYLPSINGGEFKITPNVSDENELTIIKKVLKNILETQNEIQNKILSNNNLILDQENIIRLNNIKINEHDSKLTEILFKFNNYLNLNERNSKLLKNLSTKYEYTVKRNDFSEFKSYVFNLNKVIESKFNESYMKIEENKLKIEEFGREHEVFQKYTIDKLKSYKNENIEYRLQQQQQMIILEEARDNKLNQHFDQIRETTKLLEKNLINEGVYRKAMIENTKSDIMAVIARNEEKLAMLEKASLETEQKIINYSKDYVTTFQELTNQYHQKFSTEIKCIQTVMQTSLNNLDEKIDGNRKVIDDSILDMSRHMSEFRNNLENIETTLKDAFENYDNKREAVVEKLNMLEDRTCKTSSTLESFMKENITVIDKKVELVRNELEAKISPKFVEFLKEINILNEKFDRIYDDNKDLIVIINNKFKDLDSTLIDNFNKKLKELELEGVIIEKKLDDKITDIKSEFTEYEKKIILLMNLHIDTFKSKINDEQKGLVDEISSKLERKIEVLKRDLEKNRRDETSILDGRLQSYVIESEKRIMKTIEQRNQ